MAKLDELAAHESVRQQAAQARLRARIDKSEKEQNEILTKLMQSTVIDKLVPAQNLYFRQAANSFLMSLDNVGSSDYTVHRHALGQVADVAGLPRTYLWKLYDVNLEDELWRRYLLTHNLNELFKETKFLSKGSRPKKFLVRTVAGEVRGFLSQNYNRKLATTPLLRTFVETCREFFAGPTSVVVTDVRVRVQYMLPIVFEPVDNEFVSFGVNFGNSDFGAGRLSVSGSIFRTSTETTSVLPDDYTRTHLGRIIKDEDLDDSWVSESTADKELEAFKGFVRDKVVSILSADSIEKTIKAIQIAHEKKIPWYQLRDRLKDVLAKQELDLLEGLLMNPALTQSLPPVQKEGDSDKATATAWWAANAVSMLSDAEKEPDRKADLQTMAGKLITG